MNRDKIWRAQGVLQKQIENSEVKIYEGTSPGTKQEVSLDFFESQFVIMRTRALYQEPLACVIAQPLPVFDIKFTFSNESPSVFRNNISR